MRIGKLLKSGGRFGRGGLRTMSLAVLVMTLTCATTASGQFPRSDPKVAAARWQAELELAGKVREGILQRAEKARTESSLPYRERIHGNKPNEHADFHLVPIPAGRFAMGSPGSETGRKADEGPQHDVRVDAFWMGRTEVTWNEKLAVPNLTYLV